MSVDARDAWLDPRADGADCKCPECFGLAEYMLAMSGNAHGLPLARGHAIPVSAPKPQPVPVAVKRTPAAQPWEPRPPRKRAA